MGVPQASLYSMNVIKTEEKVAKSKTKDSEFDVSEIVAWIKLYWPLICLVLFFSLFYLVYIHFFTADLGRHIVNGREIVSGGLVGILNPGAVFKTNYYSFTQTDFPFTNHHWLFGVIVFYLHQIGGFSLLTLANTTLNTLAFIFILAVAINTATKTQKENHIHPGKKQLTVWVVTTVGFLLLPLLSHRTEIRPESVSILFFSLYYFLFRSLLIQKKKWLMPLVLFLQIVWTNTHLFFILGPLLAGYFLFERLLTLVFDKSKKSRFFLKTVDAIFSDSVAKFWISLFIGLCAVGILNPNGVKGLLAPLTIFNNYAYRVAENQSTFFMINYGSQVTFHSFVVLCSFFVLLLGIFSLWNKKDNKENSGENYGVKIAQLFLVLTFALLANKINRLTPFFAIIAIPFIVKNSSNFIEKNWEKYKNKFQNTVFTMVGSTTIFILFIIVLQTKIFLPKIELLGLGLLPETQNAAQFFIQNNLRGPIFNNYDIGGYLAYNLFPQEKLFLDNRPEAYSAEFLVDEYLQSLIDEKTWQKVSDKYNLNVIFFYRHDQIDGAQQFLFNRITDPDWVPVYVDGYALILVKNSEPNKKIIEKFELPKEIFGMNPNK